jgi:hypothetical protein
MTTCSLLTTCVSRLRLLAFNSTYQYGHKHLYGLASSDPSLFRKPPKGKGPIQLTSSGIAASFAMIGCVSHSALFSGDGGRQVNVVPDRISWPRASAVIGAILGQETLFVPTYKQGVTFSTYTKAFNLAETSTSERSLPKQRRKPLSAYPLCSHLTTDQTDYNWLQPKRGPRSR